MLEHNVCFDEGEVQWRQKQGQQDAPYTQMLASQQTKWGMEAGGNVHECMYLAGCQEHNTGI
jgi:hypothetical protein